MTTPDKTLCPDCNYGSVPIACPDNKRGCLVYHSKICPTCNGKNQLPTIKETTKELNNGGTLTVTEGSNNVTLNGMNVMPIGKLPTPKGSG